MLLRKYLDSEKQGRKILIVSDLTRGQAIVRKIEAESDKLVRNVTCMNLSQMVDMIYKYDVSERGFEEELKSVNDLGAAMLFGSVLFDAIKELKYFNNEKMMDTETVQEIFNKANLVRANGWSGEESKEPNDRVEDLKTLIAAYEKRLKDDKLIDRVAKYRYAVEVLNKAADAQQVIADVFAADISFVSEDTEKFTGIERKLLSLLAGTEETEVKVFEAEPDIASLDNCSGKASFYRGYGSFNEASFVANDILEKKHPFGQVTVFYSSASQLPAISSALRGNGINMNILSNYPAKDNSYISLAKRILAWAEDDFSEKAFDKVLLSPVICAEIEVDEEEKKTEETGEITSEDVKVDESEEKDYETFNREIEEEDVNSEESDDGVTEKKTEDELKEAKKKKRNVLGGQRYYDFILNARRRMDKDNEGKPSKFVLGWGYERNCKFVKKEEKIEDKYIDMKAKLAILEVHKALLDIFGEDEKVYACVKPAVVFDKLLEFIRNHTKSFAERRIGQGSMIDLSKALQFSTKECTLKEAISIINEQLAKLSATDSEDSKSVKVQSVSDWRVVDRPYVYVTGLALADMRGRASQSPVLFDEELENFLNEGYVPTLKNEAELREKSLLRSLKSFNGESIVFGYSDFDSELGYEKNASAVFRMLAKEYGDYKQLKDIPEFVYGNPDGANKDYTTLSELKKRDEFEVKVNASNTALEELVKCPKSYALSRLLYIPENKYTEKKETKWLDAGVRGTFFHEIAEKYCDGRMNYLLTETLPDIDEAYLRKLIKDIEKEMFMILPSSSEDVADDETEKIAQQTVEFFTNLTREFNETGWRVLSSEQRFSDSLYVIKDYDDNEHEFSVLGYIDRIDYRIDDGNKKIELRIADYKTGRKKHKKEEDEHGLLLQHMIYENAVMNTGKVRNEKEPEDAEAETEGIQLIDYIVQMVKDREKKDLTDYSPEFSCFRYEFPLDPTPKAEDEEYIKCIVKNPEDLKGTNELRLKAVLTVLGKKKVYPDVKELQEFIQELKKDYTAAATELENLVGHITSGSCEYCDYHELCLNRKAGEIQ